MWGGMDADVVFDADVDVEVACFALLKWWEMYDSNQIMKLVKNFSYFSIPFSITQTQCAIL